MANVRWTVSGGTALKRAIEALGERGQQAGAAALYREANRIMTESKENYVPVADDTLRGSGFVELPEIAGDNVEVTMGYGGAASAYALAVHEHLSEHSPQSWEKAESAGRPVQFHPTGHGPKYLEIPVIAAQEGFDTRIAADVKPVIETV